jgi:sulfotransferase family protein
MSEFKLLMIGAMYENGGNTTHRLLDGHPQLYVYPFESQLGTRLVNDPLSSIFPVKYRWPVFGLDATSEQDYAAIIDEETRVRARTPHVSKFRDHEFDFSDDERRDRYVELVSASGRSRPANVKAFFTATFDVWRNFARTGREEVYVGYSPVLVVDAEAILEELPLTHFLHVVRNPWSAYADTKKRPVPLTLAAYMLGWTLNQQYALILRQKYPERLHVLRLEDTLADPAAVLGGLCERLGLERSETLAAPSWNGQSLTEVHPWGTIRAPTLAANQATAAELTAEERAEVALRAGPFLELLGYDRFLSS